MSFDANSRGCCGTVWGPKRVEFTEERGARAKPTHVLLGMQATELGTPPDLHQHKEGADHELRAREIQRKTNGSSVSRQLAALLVCRSNLKINNTET